MTTKFGWCLDGHHAPPADDPDRHGCPGQVGGPDGITCTCPCHHKDEDHT